MFGCMRSETGTWSFTPKNIPAVDGRIVQGKSAFVPDCKYSLERKMLNFGQLN